MSTATAGPSVAAGPRRQRDDAVGEQHRLVDVVGDQHDRLLARAPRCARSRPAAWRASARPAPTAARPSAAPRDPSPARARAPRAAACRPTARDGLLVARRRQVDQREVASRCARASARAASRGTPGRRPGGRSRRRSATAAASSSGRRRRDRRRARVIGLPSSVIVPASGAVSPAIMRDQRRLARARVADDGDELAALDRQVDVAPAPRCARPPLAVALADARAARERAIGDAHAALQARRSTTLIRRSRTNPTTPIVRMHRMMCS